MTFELSAPHRILTIALRRRVLVGIDTLDDLFDQPERHVLVKPEFKDKPILLKGGKRGRSVQENEPMRAAALTEYLSLRGKKIGLVDAVTFYSIRRNTAMDLSAKLGSDMARAIMAHEPNSHVMEKHYTMDRTALPDLTTMILGINSLANVDNRPLDASAVFHRLSEDHMLKLGPMLNNIFRELREMDEDYPHDGASNVQKNRDRVLRRAALRATMKELAQDQQTNVTVDATNLDVEKLQSLCNEFNRRVLEEAKRSIADETSPTVTGDSQEAGNQEGTSTASDLDEDFAENVEENPEADAEDQFKAQIEQNEAVNTFPDEIIDDVNAQLPQMDYATAARAAMEVWLAVGNEGSAFGSKQNVGVTVVCPRCQEDDTVDDAMKSKRYAPSRLSRHQDGEFHSGYQQFLRRAVIEARQQNLQGLRCEICVAVAPPGIEVPCHSTKKTLTRHIDLSDAVHLSAADIDVDRWWEGVAKAERMAVIAAHDRVKTEIGWYTPDFRGTAQRKAKNKSQVQQFENRQLALSSDTFALSSLEELPRPVDVGRGIKRGSDPNAFEDYLRSNPTAASMITMGEMPTPDGPRPLRDAILRNPALSSVITWGDIPASGSGPDRLASTPYAHLVSRGPMPGSAGYDDETVLDKVERQNKGDKR